ncbi:unnamed protein product [Nippostrongylus brasiliensis]|uniref:Secreted protein n=1 Tax=Nippostrongylus brasiliensis TaxID=27835 RepID=A0A0N4YTG0_NIPBR|nr:unnamed protein product [Nippostrongylus brasiliensis]
MSYPRRLILALPILLCILIQVRAVEVNVVKYEGLRSTELKRPDKRNQFYEFEFCLCPHNVQLRSEKRGHPKCECAPPKKGKRVADSTPYAIFPTSCLVKPNPRTCLGASFKKDNDRLFVKVSVDGIPVTQPAWQELPMAQYKRTESLVSTATMPLKLTYTTTHKTPTSTTTMRPWKLKTAKPAPIFKLITPKDQESVVDESLIPKTRVTKAIQSWTSSGKDEISSVSYYSDVSFIFHFRSPTFLFHKLQIEVTVCHSDDKWLR